ncbi:hypothetical protein L798_14345 [Zootermopsis nevadensis]|uniref:Uncharacterized protein n=1 Tax=Zootermopsis nevadensis TaxID=136037 RepID=A0A067QX33_ZOONE|nr:hypothetical protein L798_14345 [Zootermopsis nevadensis]
MPGNISTGCFWIPFDVRPIDPLESCNEPQAYTFPSLSSAAVCESPAVICTAWPSRTTFPGSISEPSLLVSRPNAPSSLQPKVIT